MNTPKGNYKNEQKNRKGQTKEKQEREDKGV